MSNSCRIQSSESTTDCIAMLRYFILEPAINSDGKFINRELTAHIGHFFWISKEAVRPILSCLKIIKNIMMRR